jgi:hypothetical protein
MRRSSHLAVFHDPRVIFFVVIANFLPLIFALERRHTVHGASLGLVAYTFRVVISRFFLAERRHFSVVSLASSAARRVQTTVVRRGFTFVLLCCLSSPNHSFSSSRAAAVVIL